MPTQNLGTEAQDTHTDYADWRNTARIKEAVGPHRFLGAKHSMLRLYSVSGVPEAIKGE
jgi:hypothetical protein